MLTVRFCSDHQAHSGAFPVGAEVIPLVAHAGVRYAFEEVMGKMYKRCIFIDDTTNATYTYTLSLLTSSAATAGQVERDSEALLTDVGPAKQ